MPVDLLLGRLEGVRGRDGSWRARCPAHGSRSGSLSIREEPDGRVLLHCFAGCSPGAVLDAVGLDFSDLFPPQRVGDRVPRGPRPAIDCREVLRAAHDEALTCATIISRAADGEPIEPTDRARLFAGAGVLARAAEVARG